MTENKATGKEFSSDWRQQALGLTDGRIPPWSAQRVSGVVIVVWVDVARLKTSRRAGDKAVGRPRLCHVIRLGIPHPPRPEARALQTQ